jgi:large subunit ribosomal protein L22
MSATVSKKKMAFFKESGFVTAKSSFLKGSVYKANRVADLVRKMAKDDVATSEILMQLKFSEKSLSRSLLETIRSAISNAENNNNLNIDDMKISQIIVGKARVLRRHEPRARGRAGIRRKRFFKYTVLLSQSSKSN